MTYRQRLSRLEAKSDLRHPKEQKLILLNFMGPDGPDHPTIDQLEHGCRFPVGVNVDGVHVFCGLPVEWKRRGAASGAYCAEHSSIA